jgi:hypothetical protein
LSLQLTIVIPGFVVIRDNSNGPHWTTAEAVMSWQPPHLPGRSVEERIEYWSAILLIPEDETGACQLREMASQRLEELSFAEDQPTEAA